VPAKISQQLDVVDQHFVVSAPQSFFDLANGESVEDLDPARAQELKQRFQPRPLLQFQPGAPRIVVERARREMGDSVVVRDLRRLKKCRDQSWQSTRPGKNNSKPITIRIRQKFGGQRYHSARLLSRVATDDEMNVRLGDGKRIESRRCRSFDWRNYLRLAERFFPGSDPSLVYLARFVARIIQHDRCLFGDERGGP